ncbi:MAG: hypothetical protein KKE76_00040 [Gammaproteobacteria bacterium]|nr:hypothetical protein [Gammaproteobacteria bacterium]
MIPAAEVRHALSKRTRLAVVERRGQADYFAAVTQTLQDCGGVTSVAANPVTGSLLIEHAQPWADIATYAEAQGLFRIQAARAEAHTPAAQAALGLAAMDSAVKRVTEGDLNARSVILLSLIALAAVQAARGQILGPASTLLWAALSLVRSEGK